MKTVIKDIFSELKKTTWLKPRRLGQLLVYTVIICGIIALFSFGLDFLFAELRNIIL